MIVLSTDTGTEGMEAGQQLLRPRSGYTRATWRQLPGDSVHLVWANVDDRISVFVYSTYQIRGRIARDTLQGYGVYSSDVRPAPAGLHIIAPRVTCPSSL